MATFPVKKATPAAKLAAVREAVRAADGSGVAVAEAMLAALEYADHVDPAVAMLDGIDDLVESLAAVRRRVVRAYRGLRP